MVDEAKRHGWAVWWDTEVSIGDQWRDVLDDCLDRARAVCVIWTVNSVGSRFVRDEADHAYRSGTLVPVRLDAVDQPLGFGEIQCADLSGPSGLERGMQQVITSIGRLVNGATPVNWRAAKYGIGTGGVASGTDRAREYLDGVRARTDMFAANPGAATGLRSALAGVRDTYAVVGESIDAFLAPAMGHGDLTLDRYRPLADGRLVTDISRRRGHCKQIAQVYIQGGGLRDSLPPGLSANVKHELDHLIRVLSDADGDLSTRWHLWGPNFRISPPSSSTCC